jgi:long-chain fatty acid transport protein
MIADSAGKSRRHTGGFMRSGLSAGLPLGLLAVLGAGEAMASGFMVRENSAEALGSVFAGNGSRADEAATVFNNPAGMMALPGPEVELAAGVVLPSVHFSGGASVLGTTPISGTNGGEAGQITGIPSFYAVFGISDNIRAGLAVTTPFGNTINYKPDWVGRYVGIKIVAQSADINPNIAWRLNDHVSIAAGVSAQYLKLEASAAIPQFAIFQAPVPDAYELFDGHDWGFGYNFGLLLQPKDDTRLGFTYRSRIGHRLSGSIDFTGANPLLGLASGPANAGANLPATADVSFTHDFTPRWTVSADLQFNEWSTFKQIIIRSANAPIVNVEHYRDSWMISAGPEYRWSDVLTLRAGLGWDQSPVTDRYRTVFVPDSNRFMLGIGAGYHFNAATTIDFGYAHYFGTVNPTMDKSVSATDPVTHAITLTGNYHNALDYLALSLRYAL